MLGPDYTVLKDWKKMLGPDGSKVLGQINVLAHNFQQEEPAILFFSQVADNPFDMSSFLI